MKKNKEEEKTPNQGHAIQINESMAFSSSERLEKRTKVSHIIFVNLGDISIKNEIKLIKDVYMFKNILNEF